MMAANVEESKKWLEIAIRRHDRHMSGKEPTMGEKGMVSQRLMMEEMKYALRALNDGYVVTTNWYDMHVIDFPDKSSNMSMSVYGHD